MQCNQYQKHAKVFECVTFMLAEKCHFTTMSKVPLSLIALVFMVTNNRPKQMLFDSIVFDVYYFRYHIELNRNQI